MMSLIGGIFLLERNLPEDIEKSLTTIFESFYKDESVYSFYPDFFEKQSFLLYKQIAKENKGKDFFKYAVKSFLAKKVQQKKLSTRYILHCYSCRKRIYHPVETLDDLPKSVTCDSCKITMDVENGYYYYDLRYIFPNKKPPSLVKENIL